MAGPVDPIAARREELARRLAALTPEARATHERAWETASPLTGGEAARTIPARVPGAPIPMSFAQELFWLLEHAQPGHTYNVPRTLRLAGALDRRALQAALDAIVARHEALRTRFDFREGNARQFVDEPRAVALGWIDMRDRDPATREAEARARVRELSRRPFDLAVDPQLRATILQLGDQDHVLLLESHHIVSDAVSRGILLRELSAFYAGFRDGIPVELPPLPVQSADFAIWQRETLRGDALDRMLAYWRERLDGVPVLELPTDRQRTAAPSADGAFRSVIFPAVLRDAVQRLSEERGTTLFMTLLAAFDALLSRYSGQSDIVVGAPMVGRSQPELAGVIGCFLNTLVLRTSLDDDPTFVELLARVRDTCLGAYEHQDVPYEKLVLELGTPSRSAQEPLFNVMFTAQEPGQEPSGFAGMASSSFASSRGATKADLSLAMSATPDGLRAGITYRTDLFDAETVDRMLGHLRLLLEGIVAQPGDRVSSIPILDAGERRMVLETWQGRALDVPATALADLVAVQVARTPDLIAVSDERGAEWTFAELDRRAERLAAQLTAAGIARGDIVGVYLEPGAPMLASLLAIHRAGAAYLPLDPGYPRDRLAFMLEDSGARLLVTEVSLRADAPIPGSGSTILVDDESAWTGGSAAPRSAPGPGDLAYVIYTSGSTGRPKGVEIEHHTVVNFLAGLREAVPLGKSDTLVAVTPLSFDISVLELFAPVTSGARVVIASRESAADPSALAALLQRAAATHMQATPATWRMLVDAGWPGRKALTALCGGEALPRPLADALLSRDLTLWNMYGPTEATIWATMLPVEKEAPITLGRPMANVRAYVLDPALQLLPAGIAGELFLGGDGLARGYHGQPELTTERFVRDPFAPRPGARMYRTGDRARWRADGTIEYLGRTDFQVKLRGHRIEMGEIEHALGQLPGVAGAAALVREDRPGDARLVAYVIADAENATTERRAEWRSALTAQLPGYMVPGAFVVLDRFPKTPNGKLDRKALPPPSDDQMDRASEYAAAATPLEQRLVAIWEEVLQRHPIGVEDEFFASGGHSLLALRVIARVAESEGIRLPLRVLFEAPTIRQLSRHIEGAVTGGRHTGAPIVRRGGDEAPLSPGQEVLWLVQRADPDTAAYNMHEQWELAGPLDLPALQSALDALVARHQVFRTTFAERNGTAVQQVHPPHALELETLDLPARTVSDIDLRRRLKELVRRPFDLAGDRLLRATLIRRGPEQYILVLVTHHIVYDGWSRGIVLRDLSALYAAATGKGGALAPLPVEYTDYAAWRHEQLTAAERDQQLGYWRDRLAASTLAVELPVDRPRAIAMTTRGGRETAVLPPELLGRLRELAKANDATLFMVLLAAFQSLLHRYSGQDDIAVGTVVAGRPQRELEGLVGYFVNTLPLNVAFNGDPAFLELLARVREGHLAASERADVPFDQVMAVAGQQAPVSACRVMFALQNNAAASLNIRGATIRRIGTDSGAAKFDLYLSMGEQADGLRATLQYRSDLFDAATARRMLQHLQVLLAGVADSPGVPVSQLPVLTEPERRLVLETWNSTDHGYPRDASIHGLFEELARATPHAVALAGIDGEVTYAELDRRSAALASELAGRGLQPGDFVVLCAERSVGMIVAMLAVLKGGAAFVPVDPRYPAARTAFIIGDTSARFVIALDGMAALVAAALDGLSSQPAVILIDSAGRAIAPAAGSGQCAATKHAGAGASPAYVMYTSGSTGTPKGVIVPHRAVVRLVRNPNFARLGSDETVLAFAPMSFDASTLEVWGPLLNGGRIAMAPADLGDLAALGEVVESLGVTTLWLTAALFQQVVDTGLNQYRGVRQLLAGGDVLSVPHVRKALAALPHTRIINGYGPTENTTFTACYTIPPEWPADIAIPIGRPISNTRVYVLDAKRSPVPVGVAGELYAAGDGVALGYLNQPDLTAEKFLPDPFVATGGARMYRTGDRVRWRSDGVLEFLGRIDQQVKIRGFRVEPGEVEVVLSLYPGMRECVVVARPASEGGAQLVAYFVAGASLELHQLREFLRERVPAHLIPSAFVRLAALPVGTTGKVDRRALPAPSIADFETGREYTAPRNAVEASIAAIWGDVLSLERVSVDHNFFDLGGQSLAAMRIVSRIQEAFHVRLPLTTLFEKPTVADVAALVAIHQAAPPAGAGADGIQRVHRTARRKAPGAG